MTAASENPHNPHNLNPVDFGQHIGNEILDLIDAAFPNTDDYNEALEATIQLLHVMFMAK